MAVRKSDLKMSVAEYLAHDDGREMPSELFEGRLYAMAPAASPHARICQNAGNIIDRAAADRPPCRAMQQVGVAVGDAEDSVFIPDVVMTCEPPAATALVQEPRLIVEVLSPSTKGFDQHTKVPWYAALPSVEEIWLVDSRYRAVHLWQPNEGEWHGRLPIVREGSFTSRALNIEVGLDDLYRLSGVDEGPPLPTLPGWPGKAQP